MARVFGLYPGVLVPLIFYRYGTTDYNHLRQKIFDIRFHDGGGSMLYCITLQYGMELNASIRNH